MNTRTRLLLTALVGIAAASALAGHASAPAEGAPAPAQRLAVVTLDGGNATAYASSGTGLPLRRSFRAADRAVLSPDARLVAYTRRVGGTVEIRVARVGGGLDRVLARVRPFDIALAFSPDGARLAYSSASGLATVKVGGGASRRIPLPAAWRGSRYGHLAFGPGGQRLYVSRTTGDGRAGTLRNELDAVELASGRGTTLFRSPNAYDMQARPVSFTPDGGYVLVDGGGAIWRVPTTPGEYHLLVPRAKNGQDHSPIVSPDGRYVAFARSAYRGVSDVYVARIEGTELRRVTTTPIPPRGTPRVGSSPLAWSPDASRLLTFRHDRFALVDVATRKSSDLRKVGVRYAISSARWFGAVPEPSKTGTIVFQRGDDSGRADLYTIRADGTGLRRLTSNGVSFDPSWSPDGDRIAFTGGHVLQRQLYVMGSDGSSPLQLTSFEHNVVAWQPSWYRAGATGLRILFTRHVTGTDGGDLYGIGSDGRTMMPITETPEPEANGSFSAGGALAYQLRGGTFVRANGVSRALGEGTEPQWSSDGTRLVLLRHGGLHGGLIGVVHADGSGFRGIAWGSSPSWSPDGTSIVYAADDGLFTIRADGVGLPRRLTRTTRLVSDLSPSWSARAG